MQWQNNQRRALNVGHVTARGNRREPNFVEDGDPGIYCDLLAEHMGRAGVEVWAHCLMPNHVHLILRPGTEDGLAVAVGAAHRRWAHIGNARGRLATADFVADLESRLGRPIARRAPGRRPRNAGDDQLSLL